MGEAGETLTASVLIDVVESCLHASRSEWIFLRELRAGTGFRNQAAQRLDAFALNTLPHTGMKRVCYEVKVSRGDFLGELKQPLKRRIGMRYSNEFYFVTPPGLAAIAEVPPECGLIEVGRASSSEEFQRDVLPLQAGFFGYDPDTRLYCILRITAPWRDTAGPTWQLLASMMRHQRRELEERPPAPPAQQRLAFNDAPAEGLPAPPAESIAAVEPATPLAARSPGLPG